ncbi:MAG TPA: M48 family metallopeptidase [Saprospiraceae bacterium]|nr:M48 family metallopeptidase [Saprospiraceae bacterium]
MNSSSIYYFDGKTSAPKSAKFEIKRDELWIYIVNNDNFTEEKDNELYVWDIKDCESESSNSQQRYTVYYGDFPKQQIQFNGSEYPELVALFLRKKGRLNSLYTKIVHGTRGWHILVGVIIILCSSWLYIRYLSPWVGEKLSLLVPKHLEERLGNASVNGILNFGPLDSLKSNQLKLFMDELNLVKDYDVKAYYVNSEVVNALAAPGGHIVVFDGIMEKIDCYDQLVALLAHEAAHVNNRHSLKSIGRSVSAYLILSAITGDVAGSSGVLLEQAAQLNQLSYARKDETQSDEIAILELHKLGLDPSAMMNLLDKLEQQEKLDSNLVLTSLNEMEFLKTHPITKNRIENLRSKSERLNTVAEYHPKLDSLYHLLKMKSIY